MPDMPKPDQDHQPQARLQPAINQVDHRNEVDMVRLRAYRLGRVQQELRRRDYAGCLLYDPVNIRYATGTRNMTIWTMHNAARYCFVPAEGRAILFDYRNCEHLAAGIETVAESRRGTFWYYFSVADRRAEIIQRWAKEIDDVVRAHGGENRRLAVDHVDQDGSAALEALGLKLFNGQEPLEHARMIKSREELVCMGQALTVCEAGLAKVRHALEPGRTEIELWSLLASTNTEMGGEYMETRLLSAGGRTNPWYQECSERRVRPREIVSIDTDMVGPFGYDADISRTFFCGPGKPTDNQRTIYRLAYEQVHHNIELLRAGTSFRDLSARAWKPPPRFAPLAAGVVIHGIGMCNEYPQVYPGEAHERAGYDGVLEANMTVCVENYIGEKGGLEGVKLEQMVLITERGPEILSLFPFEDELLA
ncbi:MAG: aminopeptidase P family protein [Alphaproteobacteria bacterium]|nr:aminopeptidase P family protein [Alphaproteobacteria bacterium]